MSIASQLCERCKRMTLAVIMSKFNTEMICVENCKRRELAHPKYKEASDAELSAVKLGVRNYPGIGCPPDLYEPEQRVENHVFTCAGCSRQWTIHSNDALECFFVGLCYWCITKHGFTQDRLVRFLRSLIT